MIRTLTFVIGILYATSAWAIGDRIDEIRVVGNRIVDSSMITLQVSSQVGESLDATKVDNDIKEIYRTGFFKTVSARVAREGNLNILEFDVKEKPAIRNVYLEGNDEISEDTFREKIGASVRKLFDERKIKAGIEAVKAHYQEKGYYGTEIEYSVAQINEDQVDVTFKVTEGKEKLIREVVFEGNKEVSSSDLQDAIKTTRYKWWSSWLFGTGVVKKDEMENDVKLLTQLYLTKGHVDARITEPVVEDIEDGLRVTFKVEEGPVYKVGVIKASGTLFQGDPAKTLEGCELKTGETFNVELLRKDVFHISSKFTDIGYAFANVNPESKINRDRLTVDINYVVDKGNLVHIDRIDITGNRKTADNVIRRTLKVEEGQLYSSSKVQRSQELLQRLGHFDEVTVSPEPSLYENKTNLNVGVKEGQTGSFSIGAGVSSGDGFIFMSKLGENNIFGTGNSLSLNVDTGTKNRNYDLSFLNPRINDGQWSGGMDLFSTSREFDTFTRDQTGGSVTFGYPLWFLGEDYLDDVRFSMEYQLAQIDINDVDEDAPTLVQEQSGKAINSSVTPKLVRNTINNPMDPTAGSKQNLGVELAGLGGDEEFWLLSAGNSFYYPVWKPAFGPFVFSHRVRVGYGDTYNDEDFPLFRRFFPGGINSVRGYEARKMGPKDENGNTYGGSKELVTNFELIFPIVESVGLRGVFFYDAGNAYDDNQSIDVADLRQAVGWGIRWRSPLAPIRLEFGYPLDKESGDKSFVPQFTFGLPQ